MFVSFIYVSVYATNVCNTDSLHLLECNMHSFSGNPIGLQYLDGLYTKNAAKKQGMCFLRIEANFDAPSVSIGYGGTRQIFLTAGYGAFWWQTYGLDFMRERRILLGTRLGGCFTDNCILGMAIDLGGGFAEHTVIEYGSSVGYDFIFTYYTTGCLYSRYIIFLRNLDFFMGFEYYGHSAVGVSLGIGYSFRIQSKKYWEYRKERHAEIWDHIFQHPQQTITPPPHEYITLPCPSHTSSGIYNESSLKDRIVKDNDAIVGIYESVSSSKDKLGVIKYGNTYRIIYMSGGSENCWAFGHVKAELRPSATLGLFKATWYFSSFTTRYDYSSNKTYYKPLVSLKKFNN